MMFKALEMAPPDPIFHLKEAFARDPNPTKINLSVGIYKDAEGNTPIFGSVKRAEECIQKAETTKSYLGIPGSREYAEAVQALLFRRGHEVIASKRAITAHTPGGTGALRVAADLIKRIRPQTRVWVSEPTWPNHPNVFRAAGLAVETYPYYDPVTNGLTLDRMLAAIQEIPRGDVILLHGCCHNPTGIDPTPGQWIQIADVLAERALVPLVDFAYQGLAEGIQEDAIGILTLCRPGCELLIASSFSKNFGLYNERVGALTVITSSQEAAEATFSHVKRCIRANYSNPPAHGAAIVTKVLGDPQLCAQWEAEVEMMRNRINHMRHLFVETLAAKGVQRDFTFIKQQRGMFSFSGLSSQQVDLLRKEHSIYLIGNGRINVAGMTEDSMDVLCQAIADVLETAPSL
jgi:aspartate/tyrosine/aromatic aminotransferase